jgi:copper chaperone CopZ|tara:strand:- start:91 stop:300 length:210 start_codon:yes stop_codon:yes gene_type:complete
MEEIKLNVEGMHCPSCEILISDELKELNGVKHVKVDHKLESVNVKFDQSKTNKQEIIEVIKKEGYKVRK